MISMSPAALDRIRRIRTEKNLPDSAPLRIGVVGGGCSGLTYKLDFETDSAPLPVAKERVFSVEDIQIVVDMRSFLYLAGTELDFTDGLNGKGFHFNNPNAKRTCSCGDSFSV